MIMTSRKFCENTLDGINHRWNFVLKNGDSFFEISFFIELKNRIVNVE